MQARDLMTQDVVVVTTETPAREIARTLLEHGISAVPVVDSSGSPVGMVSEGDLIGRSDADRDARRDWWLALLAEGATLSTDFLSSLEQHPETAGDIMTGPLVTVGETTDAAEIARLLGAYRIKRVPVVRDGRIVGVVSRADLLRALAAEQPSDIPRKPTGIFAKTFDSIDRGFHRLASASTSAEPRAPAPAVAHGEEKLNATDFRTLVTDFKHDQSHRREEERRATVSRRKQRVQELIDHHVGDDMWHSLLHKAREAAEHGESSIMLLRFPGQLCSDGGRAINVGEPDWPKTLRGEAAEIYLHWEHDLRPHGFHLSAQILEFPGGVPGDVGLFLVWG